MTVEDKEKQKGKASPDEKRFTLVCDTEEDKDIIDYLSKVPRSYVMKEAVRLWMREEQKRKNGANEVDINLVLQAIASNTAPPVKEAPAVAEESNKGSKETTNKLQQMAMNNRKTR